MTRSTLHDYLDVSVRTSPDRPAVEETSGASVTFRELGELSDRVRDRLHRMGVRPGDRVGLYLRKTIDAVAAIFGVLKSGAAYVPVDPGAPPARNAYILTDCTVRTALVQREFEEKLRNAAERPLPPLLLVEGDGGGTSLRRAVEREEAADPAPAVETVRGDPDALAYILYTSGSTGRPKGVMLSHRNAMRFVDWCSDVLAPEPEDRFSSHAPFHFDLSILDLYVPLKHGATLVLFGEELGKDPMRLAEQIAERRITSWYSAPSILSLLAQFGGLDKRDYSPLRRVLFAGEVFPVKHLRALQRLLPRPRYLNLYGPTETNVCTYYEVATPVPDERTEPYPIGKVCAHYRGRVVDPAGADVDVGAEGELCIAGDGVMQGYWNLPDQTARCFLVDGDGTRWYRTGDLVVEAEDGNLQFRGRRDRMVKRRGYRVELGEIEAGLYRHPSIREVAVVPFAGEDDAVRIKAFLTVREGKRPSLIELKRFSADNLPLYMVPDQFSIEESLPKTSTDKIDYQRLMERG